MQDQRILIIARIGTLAEVVGSFEYYLLIDNDCHMVASLQIPIQAHTNSIQG